MFKWVHHDDAAQEGSGSDSDEQLDEDVIEEPAAAPGGGEEAQQERSKIKIKLGSSSGVCHVCGQKGHVSGFVGAVYFDCPAKPCYLCGVMGHSTRTCPYRIAPGHGCTPAVGASGGGLLSTLRKREAGGRCRPVRRPPGRWQIQSAVLKLHARRVTCLEFHPTQDNLVLSGDKHGQVAIWDWARCFERTVYKQGSINRWQTNALRFLPGASADACATASFDGTVKVFDIETGAHRTLLDVNGAGPGWDGVEAEEAAGRWTTILALDVLPSATVVVAGDSRGTLHFLDSRTEAPVSSMQLHKKNTKLQSVHVNPADPNYLLTAGNDYTARLLDVRALSAEVAPEAKGKGRAGSAPPPAQLAVLGGHTKVINAAIFSPVTGRKVLTTCQDNRLRVWDNWALGQNDGAADREIVHSHTFNRYLTAFKAEWDPKDGEERLITCGRYISEDFGGVALHPVDLMDASTGALVGQLADPNLATISPVNRPHPRRDVIISGSSRSLYAWGLAQEEEEEEEEERQRVGSNGQGQGSQGAGSSGSQHGQQEGLTLGIQGASHFVFFDADEGGSDKKKPRTKSSKSATTTQTKTKGGGKAKAKEEEQEEEESD